MKTNSYELYYPRNFFSLIQILGFLEGKKHKNKKRILFININSKMRMFDKKTIFFFKKLLSEYFEDIRFIDYYRNISVAPKSFLSSLLKRSQIIDKFSKKTYIDKKINISTIYSSGDDFEVILLKKTKCSPSFCFLEHGYGNLRDACAARPHVKNLITNTLFKILFKLKLSSYKPINYNSYLGILSKHIKQNIFFNSYKVKKKIYPKKIINILSKINDYIKNNKKIYKQKYNYILLNFGTLTISDNRKDFEKLFNQILSQIKKKKKDCFILKYHPRYYSSETNKFIKKIKNLLKKNGIKIIIIKRGFLSNLPSELFVNIFNIKKIFSDMSSIPFNSSEIYKNIKCTIPFQYSLKNTSSYIHRRDVRNKRFFNKIGKKISFI